MRKNEGNSNIEGGSDMTLIECQSQGILPNRTRLI